MPEPRKNIAMKPEAMERVSELGFKINSIRLKRKMKPLMDSTLVHELLETALDTVQVTPEGNLYISAEDITGCDSLEELASELKKTEGNKDLSNLYYRK